MKDKRTPFQSGIYIPLLNSQHTTNSAKNWKQNNNCDKPTNHHHGKFVDQLSKVNAHPCIILLQSVTVEHGVFRRLAVERIRLYPSHYPLPLSPSSHLLAHHPQGNYSLWVVFLFQTSPLSPHPIPSSPLPASTNIPASSNPPLLPAPFPSQKIRHPAKTSQSPPNPPLPFGPPPVQTGSPAAKTSQGPSRGPSTIPAGSSPRAIAKRSRDVRRNAAKNKHRQNQSNGLQDNQLL